MDNVLENITMFLGSGKGLILIGIIIYTIYISHRESNYLYFLWLLIPIIPVIHFLATKKPIKIWVFFGLIILFIISFVNFLEPDIAEKHIKAVSFTLNNTQYEVNQQEQPRLINDIKWSIYKTQLLKNLGCKVTNLNYYGRLKITLKSNSIIEFSFPLQSISKLIEN